MQQKVLSRIKKVIETAGLEALQISDWSNTGHISIQNPDDIGELGSVHYNFQCNYMTFTITIGKDKVLSQPPRQGYYTFYIEFTDGDKYAWFETVLKDQLSKLYESVDNYTN